jgi:tRNA threonylcarbamoyladenosine biosynthesis protein TsaB
VRVLAIETSVAWGSVALADAAGVIAERVAEVPGQHLEWLVPSIETLLADASIDRSQVDGLAVSLGPGRFNGLRIGLVTATAWATTARRPLVGISTLDAVATGALRGTEPDATTRAQASPPSLILAVADVRRGEVAVALYRRASPPLRLAADTVALPSCLRTALPAIAEPVLVVGDALQRYASDVLAALAPWGVAAPPDVWQPRASAVALLGRTRLVRGEHDDLTTLVPRYARPVDAREFAR